MTCKSPVVALACRFVFVFAALIAAASAFGLAHGAPKSVNVTYTATMNGLTIGSIKEHFESDGSAYKIISDTKPIGLAALIQRQPLRFTSTGQIAREGLRPTLFEARRTIGEPPQVSADLDWSGGQVVLKHDGKTESFSLPAGTQDRLSVMYQFMFMPLERIRQLDFPMTNGRKLDHYRYHTTTPDVEIDTGLGRLKTVHLVKVRDPGDTVNEVWLSPQHQYLPVKMLIVERNGIRFEQVVQSLELHE